MHVSSAAPAAPSKPARRGVFGSPILWLVLALTVGGGWVWRAAAVPSQPSLPVLFPVPPFELTSQEGKPFRSELLRGKVWVADFIFTRCPSICPTLTGKMIELQRRTAGLGDSLQLVSFTVDPEYDSPKVLDTYARKSGAVPGRWTFLTGSREALTSALVEGLKTSMTREGPADDLMSIGHGGHFVLVDREMQIRGYYAAQEPGAMDHLVADAERLADP